MYVETKRSVHESTITETDVTTAAHCRTPQMNE